ncbi:MAG: hypothetical protein ABIG44_00325, partial [Planctomycetota bacterium]
MRCSINALVATMVLASLVGCASPEPRQHVSDMRVRFIAPANIAGQVDYETDHLRVSVTDPTGQQDAEQADMLCALVVENKRDLFAWITSKRSYLIDQKHGATNLLWQDAPIPAKSWTKISGVAPGFINLNLYWQWPGMVYPPPRPTGGTQRILLHVIW